MLGEEEYASRTAGLSVGFILAVIIPIFLITICISYHMIQSRAHNNMEAKQFGANN